MKRGLFLTFLLSVSASAPGELAAQVTVEARVVNVIDGCRDLNKNGKVDPFENLRIPVEERVNDLLPRMTH